MGKNRCVYGYLYYNFLDFVLSVIQLCYFSIRCGGNDCSTGLLGARSVLLQLTSLDGILWVIYLTRPASWAESTLVTTCSHTSLPHPRSPRLVCHASAQRLSMWVILSKGLRKRLFRSSLCFMTSMYSASLLVRDCLYNNFEIDSPQNFSLLYPLNSNMVLWSMYYMCSPLIHRACVSVIGCRWQAWFFSYRAMSQGILEQFLLSAKIVNIPQIPMNFGEVG